MALKKSGDSGVPATTRKSGVSRAKTPAEERSGEESVRRSEEDYRKIALAVKALLEEKLSNQNRWPEPGKISHVDLAYNIGLNKSEITKLKTGERSVDLRKLLMISYFFDFNVSGFIESALHPGSSSADGPTPAQHGLLRRIEATGVDTAKAEAILRGIVDMGPCGEVPAEEWLGLFGALKRLGEGPGYATDLVEGVIQMADEARKRAIADGRRRIKGDAKPIEAESPAGEVKDPARGAPGISVDLGAGGKVYHPAPPEAGEPRQPEKSKKDTREA